MLISVVIPLYNKKDSVKRALDSILIQIFIPLEIIVVNDGSTDGSERIVEELDHPLIRLVHQDNAGVSAARNKGIELAKGEWIAFLDADDYWDANFIYEINQVKNKYSDSNVIFCRYRYFEENMFTDANVSLPGLNGICNNYFEIAVKGSPPIWTGAVAIKKESLIAVGNFNYSVKIGEDLLLWAQLAARNEIFYINKVLSNYNFPINSAHLQKFRFPDEGTLVSDELQKILHLLKKKSERKYLKKYIGKWHKMRLHLYAHHNKFHLAFKDYLISIKYDFFNVKTHLILPIYLIQFIMGIKFIKNRFK